MKTLSDAHNHDVNFHPERVAVRHLRTLHAPSSLGTNTPRVWPVEKQTYTVHADVLKATIEDDSDIHLVISVPGSSSQTMIVEFPDPRCIASPFKRPQIRAARAALLSNCGTISSSSFTDLSGMVDVTGVGFWDEIHGQTEIAPNGSNCTPSCELQEPAPVEVAAEVEVVEVAECRAHRVTARASSTTGALITIATVAAATGPTTPRQESHTALQVPIPMAWTRTMMAWDVNDRMA